MRRVLGTRKGVEAVSGRIKRTVLSMALAVAVSGCSNMFDTSFLNTAFWDLSPIKDNNQAELGVAELAKGNYVTAEGHFLKALRVNPKDVDALIGAGILYQNTRQTTKAREMYEAVLALRPDESRQFVVWNNITTRPVSQIASVNLSLLDSGGIAPGGSAVAAQPMPSMLLASPQPIAAAPTTTTMLGRTASTAGAPMAADVAAVGQFVDGDANLISRFSTLRALRDQGLLTEDEFVARRRTNIGALLPLTSPPPAAGLDRPVPSTEQISGRLKAIGRALEMRAISVAQHSAERAMILDALMPSAPVVIANPGVPPTGIMEAADNVRRLEILRDAGYIGSDEYARERRAIEQAMQPPAPAPPVAAPAMPAAPVEKVKKEESKAAAGPQPAVHLASYRSHKNASRGWTQIKRANKKLLSDLSHEIVEVNLGKKGVYFRLKAGPFKDNARAKDICRKLKRRRQFCEPSTMQAG